MAHGRALILVLASIVAVISLNMEVAAQQGHRETPLQPNARAPAAPSGP